MTALIALADYAAPPMPAEDAVRKVLTRLGQRLGLGNAGPLLQQRGLEHASLRGLDGMCQQPPDGYLGDAMAPALSSWLQADAPGAWLKLLVLPPCAPDGLVEDWARSAGHDVLAPPPRRAPVAADAAVPHLEGSGLLVLPQLEAWFMRQRDGLHAVRALLARLAGLERHVLIACNAWAWRYLVKAVGADLFLPRPQTLAPTGAAGLRDWFARAAIDDTGRRISFRLAKSGDDVLATDDSGAPRHGHLQHLAARSGGVPWVAAQLWRASLNVRRDAADDDLQDRARLATGADERTVWVADVDECALPAGHEDRSLLALQALLIHGALTAQELDSVLPATGEPDVLPALVAAGFVEHAARGLRVRTLAYPAVRLALVSADFPGSAI